MPALLIYLLKVNIALLLFCLGYYTILKRLTFYTLNRIYLVLALTFSSLYPFINLTTVVRQNARLVKPLGVIMIDFDSKVQSAGNAVAQTDYWQWVIYIFWAGVGLMSIRRLVQFWSLFKLYQRSKPAVIKQYAVRVITDQSNPFSFWQSIYINPKLHTDAELASIIAHEQVHVKQWHTLDVLLAELSLIFYWFNPGVWLIKRAINENLEFITDRNILQQGVDAKSYQYSLLYTSVNTSSNAIVNHFNISTIKKRIIMMNLKNSTKYSITRYGFVIPAMLVLLLTFGTTKAAFIKQSVKAAQGATTKALYKMALTATDTPESESTRNETTQLTAVPKKGNEALPPNAIQADGHATFISDERLSHKHTDVTKIKADTNNIISIIKKAGMKDSSYIVLNGNESGLKQLQEISLSAVASINIVKATSAKVLYGPKGENGAIVITTKDGQNLPAAKAMKEKLLTFTGAPTLVTGRTTLSADTIVFVQNEPLYKLKLLNNSLSVTDVPLSVTSNANLLKPLHIQLKNNGFANPTIIIDGKVASQDDFKALNLDQIQSIDVLKNKAELTAYGPDAQNGVIKITTKSAAKN